VKWQTLAVSWKCNISSSSVFSSPCLSVNPYQLVAATLSGHLVALHPVCIFVQLITVSGSLFSDVRSGLC